MATNTELERVALMANALRPDWPPRSVLTYLQGAHSHRAYRDLAVAVAFVATDPQTKTPRRLSEAGPWWTTTRDAPTAVLGPQHERCPQPFHGHYLADNCGACKADAAAVVEDRNAALVAQGVPPDQVARIFAEHGVERARDYREAAAGDD